MEYSINKVATEKYIDADMLTKKFIEFAYTIKKNTGDGYIHLKQVVFKENITNIISTQLVWLFSKRTMYMLLLSCFLLNLLYLIENSSTIKYRVQHNVIFDIVVFGFYLVSLIIHELGHAAGTKAVGQRAKEIGFGFYLIFPVFYTDVTSVWNLRKRERIIVNIGGVYFQLIINSISIIYVFVFPHSVVSDCIHCLIFSNILVIIFSITPFFRNDGYWILSDYWNILNLQKKSDEYLIKAIINMKCKEKEERRIVLFGIINNIFRLYVLCQLGNNVYVFFQKVIESASLTTLLWNLFITIISMIGILLITSH